MRKNYMYKIQFVLLFGLNLLALSSVIAQQDYDDCVDAYDITSLLAGMQENEIVTSIQFDNTTALGGEETDQDNLICLFDKVIENSLWVKFTGDGSSYIIGTTECGATDIEYLNTSQALIYKGECGNLEFISCNEFQQELQDPNDFTFKAYLATEADVEYYMLLDGSNATFDPNLNVTGKFCLEIEKRAPISCGDNDLEFTWKIADGLDEYVCDGEFQRFEVVELVVPNDRTELGNTSGYIIAYSMEDMTDLEDPLSSPTTNVGCCFTEADRVYNYLHEDFGNPTDLLGEYFIKCYYYHNAPFSEAPEVEDFPDLNKAECVIPSNQLFMHLLPAESDMSITSATITNSNSSQGNGSISLSIEGGAGEYEIFWDTGDTGTSIDNLEAGEYTVTITDLSFCYAPLIVSYTITGSTSTNDLNDDNQFSIYPNPSTGMVNLSSDKFIGETDIVVYSIDGKVVYNQVRNLSKGSSIDIDLHHVDSGIYMVKSFNGKNIAEQRLVIIN